MSLIIAVIILWIICYFAPSLLSWELPEWMPWGFNSFLIAFLVIGAVFVLAAYVSEGQIGSAKYRAIQKAHSENPTSVCPQCGSRNVTVYRKGYDYNKGFWYSVFKVRGGMYLAGMDRNKAMCACRDCNHRWETDREILVGGGQRQTGEAVTENDAPPPVNRKEHLKIWAVVAAILCVFVLIVNVAAKYDYDSSWERVFEIKMYSNSSFVVTNLTDESFENVSFKVKCTYVNGAEILHTTRKIKIEANTINSFMFTKDDMPPNWYSGEKIEVVDVIYS